MSDIEREEFEQAFLNQYTDFERIKNGEYTDDFLQQSWIGWQASRQALEGQDARLIHLLADIRFACGDDGKRMQGELVEYIGELARKAGELEGEPVGYTNQYQLDKFPLGESGYVFRDKRDDSTIPLYTHPASAATLQFGNGNLVVTGGSFDDVPAVFISPAIDLGNAPGTALSGKDAERRTDMLYGDETVLLFKTAEHASVVVGALIRGNDASADKWIKCSEQRPNVLDVWIKMTDGSVVACWAQLDGDFYWKGGGFESYILEHTVTHWKPRQEEQGHE